MNFLVLAGGNRRAGDIFIGEGCELLRQAGSITLVGSQETTPGEVPAEFKELMPEADAIVISPWYRPPTQPEEWRRATKMKVLSGTFDHRFDGWMDFADLTSRGVVVVDTSRSMTPSVAEFALAMTLNLIRDIPDEVARVRRGEWVPMVMDKPGFVFGDLTGRQVGLAGFGSINRRYCELVAPFRCDVGVFDPFVSDEALQPLGAKRVDSLVELARRSEIFIVGLPPTPTTQQIISREVLEALPAGALLVLVTRMAVMDQEALWERVQAGKLRAAVDVFAPEPPPSDAWFRRHPNVLPTPHIAGGTVYCHRRCFTEACRDAIAVLKGENPRWQAKLWDHQVYVGQPTKVS
jgi:phosphoglycerate dehydrogenase-like enzyme